jgi:predicted Zn-dependent peptidase
MEGEMDAPEEELAAIVAKELDWYRGKTMLAQTIKEVAREAMVDVLAESVSEAHAELIRGVMREDLFRALQEKEGRRLLLEDNSHSLMKEAVHRAVRLEIHGRLDLPEPVDQLDLPWNS